MKHTKLFGILISGLIIISLTSCEVAPSASFTMSDTSIEAGQTVIFTNTTTDGSTYEWDFGDGGISTLESPTHTYTTVGTFTVTLIAHSSSGSLDDQATATITVIQSTELALTVIESGTVYTISDCLVELTANSTDWLFDQNIVASGNTDSNGKISFTGLQPIVYYIDAKKTTSSGQYDNYSLGIVTPNPLVANTINSYIVYVEFSSLKSGAKTYKVIGVEPLPLGN